MITLSILMCGLDSREAKIKDQILHQISAIAFSVLGTTHLQLSPNVEKYVNGNVEFLIYKDDGEVTSGIKRQTLTDLSEGKYICFVDDDDQVSNDYVAELMYAAHSNADILSFNLDYYSEGRLKEHWKFGLHRNYRTIGLMAANHLCAWKRTLATKVAWSPELGYGDDRLWFEPLHASNLIKSCYHINKSLYYYYYSKGVSANQTIAKHNIANRYFGKGLRCFMIIDNIFIEDRASMTPPYVTDVIVRNHHNEVSILNSAIYEPFHVVKR